MIERVGSLVSESGNTIFGIDQWFGMLTLSLSDEFFTDEDVRVLPRIHLTKGEARRLGRTLLDLADNGN